MNKYLLFLTYILCSNGGIILVKLGGSETHVSAISNTAFQLKISYLTLLGMLLYIISFVLWIMIIPKYNLNYIFPMSVGIGYLLIMLASLFLFKESFSVYQIIGVCCILSGIVFINIK